MSKKRTIREVLDHCNVETTLMKHESGHKFYMLVSVVCRKFDASFFIRRCGDIANVGSGGQIRIQHLSMARSAADLSYKVVSSEIHRDYSVVADDEVAGDECVGVTTTSTDRVIRILMNNGAIDTAGRIMTGDAAKMLQLQDFFTKCGYSSDAISEEISDINDTSVDVWEELSQHMKDEESQKSIVNRSESWGSW